MILGSLGFLLRTGDRVNEIGDVSVPYSCRAIVRLNTKLNTRLLRPETILIREADITTVDHLASLNHTLNTDRNGKISVI